MHNRAVIKLTQVYTQIPTHNKPLNNNKVSIERVRKLRATNFKAIANATRQKHGSKNWNEFLVL